MERPEAEKAIKKLLACPVVSWVERYRNIWVLGKRSGLTS